MTSVNRLPLSELSLHAFRNSENHQRCGSSNSSPKQSPRLKDGCRQRLASRWLNTRVHSPGSASARLKVFASLLEPDKDASDAYALSDTSITIRGPALVPGGPSLDQEYTGFNRVLQCVGEHRELALEAFRSSVSEFTSRVLQGESSFAMFVGAAAETEGQNFLFANDALIPGCVASILNRENAPHLSISMLEVCGDRVCSILQRRKATPIRVSTSGRIPSSVSVLTSSVDRARTLLKEGFARYQHSALPGERGLCLVGLRVQARESGHDATLWFGVVDHWINNQTTVTKHDSSMSRSMMHLQRCFEAIRWNDIHRKSTPKLIPYRESVVTKILNRALTGHGVTHLHSIISSSSRSVAEVRHILEFSSSTLVASLDQPITGLSSPRLRLSRRRLPLSPKTPQVHNEADSNISGIDPKPSDSGVFVTRFKHCSDPLDKSRLLQEAAKDGALSDPQSKELLRLASEEIELLSASSEDSNVSSSTHEDELSKSFDHIEKELKRLESTLLSLPDTQSTFFSRNRAQSLAKPEPVSSAETVVVLPVEYIEQAEFEETCVQPAPRPADDNLELDRAQSLAKPAPVSSAETVVVLPVEYIEQAEFEETCVQPAPRPADDNLELDAESICPTPKQAAPPFRDRWAPLVKPSWQLDSEAFSCLCCRQEFNLWYRRRHHCRLCGFCVCYSCSTARRTLPWSLQEAVRVCDACVFTRSTF